MKKSALFSFSRMPYGTVRARLTLLTVLVLGLSLTGMCAAIHWTVGRMMTASIDADLDRHVFGIVKIIEQDRFDGTEAIPPVPPFAMKAMHAMESDTDSFVSMRPRLFSRTGSPFAHDIPDTPWDPHGIRIATGGHAAWTYAELKGRSLRVLTAPIYRNGHVVALVQCAYPLQELQRLMTGLTRGMLTMIPVGILVTAFGAGFLTNRMLRPVREITDAAGKISSADLSQRLPVEGNDEFSKLSATFNGMLARLELAFERQRRFTLDASHELRTPLTAIAARASLGASIERTPADYQRDMAVIERAAALMTRITEDLLTLARSEETRIPIVRCETAISEVVEEAVALMDRRQHAPITVQNGAPHAHLPADFNLLVRLLCNLLENAARHTPQHGKITVEVCRTVDAVVIHVRDTGIGIAAEHLPRLRERFYRVDEARGRKEGGVGLGLAICQAIVDAHNAQLDIESEPGRGTCVTITFPAAK